DVDLRLTVAVDARAKPELVVEIVARVEVHVGAADASGPVPDRVQGGPRRRLAHVGDGVLVLGVGAARAGLVHDRGGAGGVLGRPALVDDTVRVRDGVRIRPDHFAHAARVVQPDDDVGLDVGPEDA